MSQYMDQRPLPKKSWIYGLRACEATVKCRPKQVRKILLTESLGKKNPKAHTFFQQQSRKYHIPLELIGSEELGSVLRSEHHEGVALQAQALKPATAEQQLNDPQASLILYADQLTNPHNLGALIRTAVFLGIKHLFYSGTEHLISSGACHRVAQGALEYLQWSYLPPNSFPALAQHALTRGYQFYLADLDHRALTLQQCRPKFPAILILGSEEQGAHDYWKNHPSVQKIMIAPGGTTHPIQSLNVSVASGILCHWLSEQRPLQKK